ncbi:hypothetical protein [Rossellomorea sp. BNER]|uniref:hypothetical protein n=1 Tax=Rossellomorea sp. BNER TaxID=2962031 RepID=UPI003AF2A3CF|nr:hypothetical protein [Rossellomorea sp. BNER]
MNNWIAMLFNSRQGKNLLKMVGRKRKNNNKRMMWASLLGIGASAAAYGLGRNQNNSNTNTNTKMMRPVQNVMNNLRTRNTGQMPSMANLTEFAKEVAPNNDPLKNK